MSVPCIPLSVTWSSPFVKWQGALAATSSIELAGAVARRALERVGIGPAVADLFVLGWTIPQQGMFYGGPSVATLMGAPQTPGVSVSQACATSVAALRVAADAVTAGSASVALVVTTDRTSNAPLLVHPDPGGPGGAPRTERWLLDAMDRDPMAGVSALRTAENVVAAGGFERAQLDEVTLLRYAQYEDALADDRAFQRRYLVDVELPGRRGPVVIHRDEGVHATTAEALAGLTPVAPDGAHTFGSQTHPADGTAGTIVCGEERARELSRGEGVARILGFGVARAQSGMMPQAPVPAARAALRAAGLELDAVAAVKTHTPFAVNDLWFAAQTGYPLAAMNAYGCSLVYGHPQGPTGMRAIAELIELLRLRGGGVGLFTGCAAGDTGAAVVVAVDD